MLKNIYSLGKTLGKEQQQLINGGQLIHGGNWFNQCTQADQPSLYMCNKCNDSGFDNEKYIECMNCFCNHDQIDNGH